MENQILNIYLGQKEHYINIEEMEKIISSIRNISNSLIDNMFGSIKA